MIIMTAVILFSINPWLALVTLIPLPFIAWMIHVVRDRLKNGFERSIASERKSPMCWPIPCPSIRAVKAFAQEKLEASCFR